MYPLLRQHMRLWCLWTIGVAALLLAIPWTSFGALELVAALGPLAMGVDRRIRRETTIAVGLPVLTLLWLVERGVLGATIAESAGASIARLLIAWSVFGIGSYLGWRAVEGYRNLEAIAGYVAFAPPDARAFEAFSGALAHELTRARRHDRSFAVLSFAPDPRSIESDDTGAFSSELLRALAENRARLELHELLMNELHAYSHVVAARERVLAIVPEVDDSVVTALVARLSATASDQLGYGTQIGVACFPRDAISAEELIHAADEARLASRLRPLPNQRAAADSRDGGEPLTRSIKPHVENAAEEDEPDVAREVQS